MTDQEVSYEEAVEKPELRQQFLDQIDLGPAKQYIKQVVYEDDMPLYAHNEHSSSLPIMTTQASCMSLLGFKGHKSTIRVSPLIFESSSFEITRELILSLLIDQQGQHAKDLYERRRFANSYCQVIGNMQGNPEQRQMRKDRLQYLNAISARMNQLRQVKLGNRNLTQQQIERLERVLQSLKNEFRRCKNPDMVFDTDLDDDEMIFVEENEPIEPIEYEKTGPETI